MSIRLRLIGAGALLIVVAATAAIVLTSVGSSDSSQGAPASVIGRPGTNLVANGDAGAGAASVQGWDAVTIPGWSVRSGLPTVVQYGTHGFARAAPFTPGLDDATRMFAGGAGGTARLDQSISLLAPNGLPPTTGTRYTLSAMLGGGHASRAWLRLVIFDQGGTIVGASTLGPVSAPHLRERVTSGVLPAYAASAKLTLVLATSQHDVDGSDAPRRGYNRALATQIALTTTAAVRVPVLTPPAATVPRYDHVFVFVFENEDFRAVIGNKRQAPFINSLLPHASLLSNLYAEEHPSDANDLALEGASSFGLPLTDPLGANPQYTLHAPVIEGEIDAVGETWADYLQSAAGPCDDTVHGSYRNDDLPQLYFASIRERHAYCATHVLPLQRLSPDLASTVTTPSLAWIGADDCADMEGCGITAGDRFLAAQLRRIMRSPAWLDQRSLAIITFDEDGADNERPAQRVATLMLASRGVRSGYVSHVRYTHYSLTRTIEAALGVGPLTGNDRWAQPVNDVFSARAADTWTAPNPPAAAASPPAAALVSTTATPRVVIHHRPAAPGTRNPDTTAFVVNSGSDTVTPVILSSGKRRRAIKVGSGPQAIAVTPDGTEALVVNSGSDSVTPINTLTGKAGGPIDVGADPVAIAMAKDGRTAYVVNEGSDTVTPINTSTWTTRKAIAVGAFPRGIAISPRGQMAFVLNWGYASVTPIDTATDEALAPIATGSYPAAIAFTRDGSSAFVASFGSDTVTPITVAAAGSGQTAPSVVGSKPIAAGPAPDALAISPDGTTLDVVDGNGEELTPITIASRKARSPIPVGYSPAAVAFAHRGRVAYVLNTISGTLTPVAAPGDHPGRAIALGSSTYPTALAIAPGSDTAVVLDTDTGQVTLVDLRRRSASTPLPTGGAPVAVAFGA